MNGFRVDMWRVMILISFDEAKKGVDYYVQSFDSANKKHDVARFVKLKGDTKLTMDYSNRDLYTPFKDRDVCVGLYVIPTLSHGLVLTYAHEPLNDYMIVEKIVYKSKWHRIFKRFIKSSIKELGLRYVEVNKCD